MVPPMLLHLRILTPEHRRIGLWLPLFLVWLLLLPFLLLALAVAIVADVALAVVGQRYHRYTGFLLGCLGVVSATRGTAVHVHSNENLVDIDFV